MKRIILSLIVFSVFAIGMLHAQTTEVQNEFENPVSTEYIIKLYPNPVIDGVLKVHTNHNIRHIEIINVIGQTIQKEINEELSTDMAIELESMQRGMYLVRVTFENKKSIIKKILVKN